jgi:hypothetical protein
MNTPVDSNSSPADTRNCKDGTSLDSRSCERERVAPGRLKGHLPRLAPEFYRGRAFVHWTLTIEDRATGWLTETFHRDWYLCLLHTSTRFHLACPAYVLMPDHMHLVWLGLRDDSDQLLAIEFFRHHLGPELSPAGWQRQAHDHVLNDQKPRQHREVHLRKPGSGGVGPVFRRISLSRLLRARISGSGRSRGRSLGAFLENL